MRLIAVAAVLAGLRSAPAFSETLHLRPIPVVDQSGFEKPVAAGTVMVPDGWTGEGGIVWRHDPCVNSYFGMALSVSSPDRGRMLAFLDLPGWHYSSNPQPGLPGMPECATTPYNTLNDFFDGAVPALFPGGRIIDRRPRPDILSDAKAAGFLPELPPMQLEGAQQTADDDAGEVLVAFQSNGTEYRADMVCLLVDRGFTLDGLGYQHVERFGTPLCALQAAPDGQLDVKLTEIFRKSYRSSPEWQRRIAQFGQNISQINAKGASDRFKITTETTAETNQMLMDAYASSSASSDRTQREAVEGIRGVETYTDPMYGGTVQLDSTYAQAWQLNDGSYVLSNDVNFDPNRELGVPGTQLQPAE